MKAKTNVYKLVVVTRVHYIRCQDMTEAQAQRENAKLRRQSDGRYLWTNQFGNIEQTEGGQP